MFQRVMTKKHTILQIGIGSIVGGMVGIFFYKMAEQQVKGIDREREDDDNKIQEGFVH